MTCLSDEALQVDFGKFPLTCLFGRITGNISFFCFFFFFFHLLFAPPPLSLTPSSLALF